MDGKGHAYDNSFTERLWRSLRYEEIYLADAGSPREARQGIGGYCQFYNTERPIRRSRIAARSMSMTAKSRGTPTDFSARARPHGGAHTEN